MKKTLLISTFAVLAITSIFLFQSGSCPMACIHKPQKRVYVDMVGDLFHRGHIALLKKAKTYGDYLIVGVHSDRQVEAYKRLPILTMEERAEVVQACKYVDRVIVGAPVGITKELIEENNIHLVIHGDDFDKKTLLEHYRIPIEMGIFKTVPYTKGISSTNILERVKSRSLIAENEPQ